MASFMMSSALFLSTPSARRATLLAGGSRVTLDISIHALREEGDWGPWAPPGWWRMNFYPRPPRGVRLVQGEWGDAK